MPEYHIPAPPDAPDLHHKVMHILYLVGPQLPVEIRHELLQALPHDTLAEDLCAILRWGQERYSRISQEGDFEQEYFAVQHAYFLAGEVGRPEVVPCLLDLLAAPEAVRQFYFGEDMLAEEGWWPLRQYLPGALPACIEFMKRPLPDDFVKSPVLYAMLYAAYSSDASGNIIMPALFGLAQFFMAQGASLGFSDRFCLTEMALQFVEDGTEEGMVISKAAYEAGLADESIAGNLEQVLAARRRYPNRYLNDPYGNVEKLYEKLEMYGPTPDDYDSDGLEDGPWIPDELLLNAPQLPGYNPQMPIVKPEKTGRNEPCPCGSGKKYKKCCLGKEEAPAQLV